MDYERQQHAPIYEALERFRKKRVVPFDVPGHKRGRDIKEEEEIRSLHSCWERNVWGWMLIL